MASIQPEEYGYWQSIVWTLPEGYADEYLALSDEEFARLLTKESQHMLGEVQIVRSRASFPLKARSTQRYVKRAGVNRRCCSRDPSVGRSGVNIGCLDAAILCDALLHDARRGVWAHERTLLRYEHRRKGQNAAMMHGMSVLGWLETRELFPVIWARNLGKKQVNQQPLIKDLL